MAPTGAVGKFERENCTTTAMFGIPPALDDYRASEVCEDSASSSQGHSFVKRAKEKICYKPPESNREPSVLPIELMLQLIVRQKS